MGTWVGVAASLPEFGGEVSLASLGHNYSMLFGNIAGILTGGAIAGLGSLATRTRFDWDLMKERIKLVDMSKADMASLDADEQTLKKAFKFSLKGGGLMTMVLIIAWPMPLFFSGYVFDIGFYSLWVAIAVTWVSVATFFYSRSAHNRSEAWKSHRSHAARGQLLQRTVQRKRTLRHQQMMMMMMMLLLHSHQSPTTRECNRT